MHLRFAVSSVFVCAASFTLHATDANAKTIIRDPNPPKYGVEIEPKLNLAYFGVYRYGGNGWGPGVRFSIPLMSPGFVKSINDSVGITFGADFVRYEGYYYSWCDARRCPGYYDGRYDPSFWALHLPIAMQWNFWLTDKFSVFAEPGLTVRKAFFRDDPYYATYCDPRFQDCRNRSSTDLYFTFFAGGRWHFSDNLALTLRLGHPIDFSAGLSIFL